MRKLDMLAATLAFAVLAGGSALAGGNKTDQSRMQSSQVQPGAWDQQTVRSAQERLNQLGFAAGPPDGVLGDQTRSALREFQQSRGLSATGEFDQQALNQLGISPNSAGGAGMPAQGGAGTDNRSP